MNIVLYLDPFGSNWIGRFVFLVRDVVSELYLDGFPFSNILDYYLIRTWTNRYNYPHRCKSREGVGSSIEAESLPAVRYILPIRKRTVSMNLRIVESRLIDNI